MVSNMSLTSARSTAVSKASTRAAVSSNRESPCAGFASRSFHGLRAGRNGSSSAFRPLWSISCISCSSRPISPGGKPSREPVEIVAGQVRDDPPLVLAERHFDAGQFSKIGRLHGRKIAQKRFDTFPVPGDLWAMWHCSGHGPRASADRSFHDIRCLLVAMCDVFPVPFRHGQLLCIAYNLRSGPVRGTGSQPLTNRL